MTARVCAHPDCSNVLSRHVGETTSRWKIRQFCSRACAAAGRSINAPSNTDVCVAETLVACTGVCGDLIHRAMKVGKCVAGHRRHSSSGRCSSCAAKAQRAGVAGPRAPELDPRFLLQEWEHLAGFGWSVTQVCDRLGLDRDVVARTLAKLPDSRTAGFRAAWERDVTNKASA